MSTSQRGIHTGLQMQGLEKREDNYLEYALGNNLHDDIAAADMAFEAISIADTKDDRRTALAHAKELILRANRELTVLDVKIEKVLARNASRYNEIVRAENSLEESL